MLLLKSSKDFQLDKKTFVNLRWIAYIGQILAIVTVQFILKFQFNYITCIVIILLGVFTNIYLQFKTKENQLSNFLSTVYLAYDIIQLGCLLFLTGGITNPFIFLLIIPTVFSSQYLNIWSSVVLVTLTILTLITITFYYVELPHPRISHIHVPDIYKYAIPVSVFIGLIFLVYFGAKFGSESRIRKEALEKIQSVMVKEQQIFSIGGQLAATAHSLGTPLSTILLIAKELEEELGKNPKYKEDINLLISQSNRCNEILKSLSLNPDLEDDFIENNASLKDYLNEIICSFEEISNKKFNIDDKNNKNPITFHRSLEINYGLRNFIGNANKYSSQNIDITIKSNKKLTDILIIDDGPGFSDDIIDKLGEPYIRSSFEDIKSKSGLGLGTFIGKTLLEKNFANVKFKNLPNKKGAMVNITWFNDDLKII